MDYNNRVKSNVKSYISLHLHVVVSGKLFEIVESSMKDELGLHSY